MRSIPYFAAGAVALAVAAGSNAAIVYSGGNETAFRFNPGAGIITYMNCFTPIQAGQYELELDSVSVGIRRLLTGTGGILVDVGLKIHAAEMTYDVSTSTYGLGASTLLFEGNLGSSGGSQTQMVSVEDISDVTLNLETVSRSGLGGWWIGVEFFGVNASNPRNGWRIVDEPTVGESLNGFAMYQAASQDFDAFYRYGNPPTLVDPSTNTVASRFMLGVDGQLVAAPGVLSLLGIAGVLAVRRR